MSRPTVRVERVYEATVDILWSLWTTKEGFESWWGPQGFRVEVHRLDPVVGGELRYDMIAAGTEVIEYMRSQGWSVSHETHGTFVEVEPMRRLKILHMIDFIPNVDAYENNMSVEFIPEGDSVRMVIDLEEHMSAEWTEQAKLGLESQLTKVPEVLERLAASK